MSRARDLSRLSNPTNFTADGTTGRVGLGSENPTAKLNVAGIVSATAFYGDGSGLIGAGIGTQGSVNTSGIITATKFVGDGSGLIGAGIGTQGSVNTSGIITATKFVGSGASLTGIDATAIKDSGGSVKIQANTSGIVVTGVSTFTGNVSIGGTLTYEDVTNIDSIGVITARSGIVVTGVVTATTFNSTSDIKLKNNVTTVDNALEVVNQLRGVRFDWKESGVGDYGVIAQELEEVLPELVSQGDPKTVNYNGIIGVLIESIKELSEKVKSLEDK